MKCLAIGDASARHHRVDLRDGRCAHGSAVGNAPYQRAVISIACDFQDIGSQAKDADVQASGIELKRSTSCGPARLRSPPFVAPGASKIVSATSRTVIFSDAGRPELSASGIRNAVATPQRMRDIRRGSRARVAKAGSRQAGGSSPARCRRRPARYPGSGDPPKSPPPMTFPPRAVASGMPVDEIAFGVSVDGDLRGRFRGGVRIISAEPVVFLERETPPLSLHRPCRW